ncbi:MAG: AI-2E family transporter [Candidatus Pacebacteria bacterium]|nr:AI-2E family transporter [Candidatus Paceibacterota bacterium]
MKKFLDISWESILKIFITILAFYILYSIKEIVIWIIFALIISILFEPAIIFLKKKKIPRILGTILIYIGFFGILGFLGYLIIPFFATEIRGFIDIIPGYFEKIYPPLQDMGFFEATKGELSAFEQTLETMALNIFSFLFTLFGGVLSAIFIITTSFFLSLEENNIEKGIILLFPKKHEAYALSLWAKCQKKVSAWFLARIIACIFVGFISYIVFFLFNIEYPLILAVLAAILNFIPYIGPLITAILLFLILAPVNFIQAVFVLVAFFLIQQVEAYVLSPLLMKKAVGVSPSLVLISLLIGAQLWGFLGAILIIPLVGIVSEFIKEFLQRKKEKEAVVL